MKLYRFPENERAKRQGVHGQAMKCREEAQEVVQAVEDGEPSCRVLEEAWDCIQACEGVLRKFPAIQVAKSLAMVKIKSLRRGDYGD